MYCERSLETGGAPKWIPNRSAPHSTSRRSPSGHLCMQSVRHSHSACSRFVVLSFRRISSVIDRISSSLDICESPETLELRARPEGPGPGVDIWASLIELPRITHSAPDGCETQILEQPLQPSTSTCTITSTSTLTCTCSWT